MSKFEWIIHRVLVFLSVVSLFLLSDRYRSFTTAQTYGGRESTKSPDESVPKLKKYVSLPNRRTVNPSRAKQISWHPRAFIYKGFLTNNECDHLISLARDKLLRSMVIDPETGEGIEDEIRTCSDMSIAIKQDGIVAGIEERIAAWTLLPEENGEDLQVQRYLDGEKYDSHYDYFEDKESLAIGGQRIATVLMYLSDVAEGGETVFPYSKEKDNQEKGNNWSDCGKKGVAVKPKKGDALLFFSLNLNSSPDLLSLHGGCPVIKGEKWSATKWIHVKPFKEDDKCTDIDDQCHIWAAKGECEHNPGYMVGTDQHPGHCVKSCKAC